MSNILSNIAAKVESGELTAEAEKASGGGMTAYQVCGLLNQAIKQFNLVNERTGEPHAAVPPQYVYNLARSGQIDGNKGPVTGVRYSDEDVAAFVTKWVARRLPQGMDEPEETDETGEANVDETETDNAE